MFYLPNRNSADAGVQHSSDGAGAHFTHKGELLPPSNTVLLHLLPAKHTHTHTLHLELKLKVFLKATVNL